MALTRTRPVSPVVDDETPLMRVPEVARLLAISRQRAYMLVSSGQLPSISIGPKVLRVRRSDFDKFLADRTVRRVVGTHR